MKTHEITLPVSGLTITVRRQPITVIQQINRRAEEIVQKTTPKPKPPVQEVVTGPNETKQLPNTNDPEYLQELEQYNNAVLIENMNQMMQILTHVGIVKNSSMSEYLDDARQVQDTYKNLGYDVPDDLLTFALQYIIAPSQDDSATLMYEVFGKSLPSEQQVAFKRAMFPSDV